MNKNVAVIVGIFSLALTMAGLLFADNPIFFAYSNDQVSPFPRGQSFWIYTNREVPFQFTTKAYNDEALRQLIREANSVAQALGLQDELPITVTNLNRSHVAPYGVRQVRGAIGSVTTANYTYYASVDSKFSFLEKRNQEAYIIDMCHKYAWPLNMIETNAPYQLATQWMAEASMDVRQLNRDCKVYVKPVKFMGEGTDLRFLPLYVVYWKKSPLALRSVASVEVFMPTKTMVSLRVEDGQYILRPRLMMTNLHYLLSQTNNQPSP